MVGVLVDQQGKEVSVILGASISSRIVEGVCLLGVRKMCRFEQRTYRRGRRIVVRINKRREAEIEAIVGP